MRPAAALPNGWPQEITYLTKPSYPRSFDRDSVILTLSASDIKSKECSIISSTHKPRPSSSAKIAPIISPSHPAYGQHGLFAARHLPPDSFILFYIGYVHGPDDVNESSNYDLSLDRELGIGVDATRMGNEARFINDYRGVRDVGPNAEFRDCLYEDTEKGTFEKRIGIYVLGKGKSGKRSAGIGKGEEILVSYGKGFWSHQTGT